MIWVYKRITRTNLGGKFFFVIFMFSDKKQYQCPTKNEDACDAILVKVIEAYPAVLAGYSESRFKSYKQNFANSRPRSDKAAVRIDESASALQSTGGRCPPVLFSLPSIRFNCMAAECKAPLYLFLNHGIIALCDRKRNSDHDKHERHHAQIWQANPV